MSLKEYVSYKRVKAEPMTRNRFCQFVKDAYEDNRNSDIPLDSWTSRYNTGLTPVDHDIPGYLVIYGEGTPNEYHSWSPAQAFESGYMLLNEETTEVIGNVIQALTNEALDRVEYMQTKLLGIFSKKPIAKNITISQGLPYEVAIGRLCDNSTDFITNTEVILFRTGSVKHCVSWTDVTRHLSDWPSPEQLSKDNWWTLAAHGDKQINVSYAKDYFQKYFESIS